MRCCKLPKYVEQELPRDILPKDTAKRDNRTGVVINSGPFQLQQRGLLVGNGATVSSTQVIQIDENSRKVTFSGDISALKCELGVLLSAVARIHGQLVIPVGEDINTVGELKISPTGKLKWRYGNTIFRALSGVIGDNELAYGSDDDLSSSPHLKFYPDTKRLVVGNTTADEMVSVEGNVVAKQIYAKPYNHGTVNQSQYTIDWNLGNYQIMTIATDVTLQFQNADAGKEILLYIKQDSTGGHTVTFPDNVVPLNSWDNVITQTPDSISVFYLKSDGNNIVIDKLGPTPSGGSGGGIGGTISRGQVAFGTDQDEIGGDNNLYWDIINKRLGIKTAMPQSELHVSGKILSVSAEFNESLIIPSKTSGSQDNEIFVSGNVLKWRSGSSDKEVESKDNKGVSGGYAPLDNSGKLPIQHLPSHANTHAAGQSDEITGDLNANARVNIKVDGINKGTRRSINFIAGSGISINAVDDGANEKVDITITNTGGGGGGGIGGSINTNQVAFGTGTNTIGGSNDFTYNDTSKQLNVNGVIKGKQFASNPYNHGTITNSQYTIDWSLGVSHEITLGNNIKLNFTNAQDGSEIYLITKQDSVGGKSVIFPSGTKVNKVQYYQSFGLGANEISVYRIRRISSNYFVDVIASRFVELQFLSGWSYARLLKVYSTQDIEGVEIRFVLDTASLISGGKMRSDGADLRITKDDGSTIVPYWIEDNLNTSNTIVWFKGDLRAGENYFWLYYGNSEATDASNPDGIFIAVDTFTGNLKSFWQILPGNGEINVNNGVVNFSYTGSQNNDWWTSGRFEKVLYWPAPSDILNIGFFAQVKLPNYTVNTETQAFISAYRSDSDAYLWGRYRGGPYNTFLGEKIGVANVFSYASTQLPAWLGVSYEPGGVVRFYISFNGWYWLEVYRTIMSQFNGVIIGGKEWGTNNMVFSMDNFIVRKFLTMPTVVIGKEIQL